MTTNPEAATAWDSNGGQAGYLYHVDYATAVADHPGATVESAFMVSDSGWLGSSYTNWITQLQYGGRYFTNS